MAKSEPIGIALLFCDNLVEERDSAKRTLVGIFSGIIGQKFPLQFRPFWLYVSFTNLEGEHSFAINIISDATKNVLFSAGGRVNSGDRDAVIEMNIPVPPIVFPEPGIYGVTLHIDGETRSLVRTLNVKTPSKS